MMVCQSIACVPPFVNLRRFPHGRGFKQWTGDDSKALMKVYLKSSLEYLFNIYLKVYLPAIEGHLPVEIVRTFHAFFEFCSIVRQNKHTKATLNDLEDALTRFHKYREVFRTSDVRPHGFNLPRQHSMTHYIALIRAFGAPNGLCSSITESKHIKAVKEPWRRSNHFEAIGQMLVINQRLDKLAALTVDFTQRGMLRGTVLSEALGENSVDEENDDGDKDDDDSDDGGDDDDSGAIEGSITSYVDMARTVGKFLIL
jgi:hypothetical protein